MHANIIRAVPALISRTICNKSYTSGAYIPPDVMLIWNILICQRPASTCVCFMYCVQGTPYCVCTVYMYIVQGTPSCVCSVYRGPHPVYVVCTEDPILCMYCVQGTPSCAWRETAKPATRSPRTAGLTPPSRSSQLKVNTL